MKIMPVVLDANILLSAASGAAGSVVGIFHHGWSLIIAALLNHRLLPVEPGRPEAWPTLPGIHPITSVAGAVDGVM
jgi:hypothetical protein